MNHNISGNVLFLILIAVALFAALSYAVTSSSRVGGAGVTKENNRISGAEVIQYATQLEQTVTRLRVINNCSVTQLSFERAPFDGSDTLYLNSNAPGDFGCHIFHPAGGAQPYRDMSPSSWRGDGQLFTIHNRIDGVGCDQAADSGCYELLFLIELEEEICLEINKRLNMLNSDGSLPEDDASMVASSFQGQSTIVPTGNAISDLSAEQKLFAKYNGCINITVLAHAGPKYYHVLIGR